MQISDSQMRRQFGQLTRDDLRGMTPEQIEDAHNSGRLDSLLGMPADDVAVLDRARAGEDDLTHSDVQRLKELNRHDLIAQALDNGRLNNLTNGEVE